MIQIIGLTKSFEGRTVLDQVEATFETGKTNLIIGRSGSGKTVMMKSIIGLIRPDRGEILYDGRNILGMGKKELKSLRREMGMLFQGTALFDSMTVMENVMFPLDMFSRETARCRRRRASFCLERVNLADARRLYPSEISGGMMKRAAIARAIALQPKYLLCDEPNSGLDPKTALVIDELIHDITREYHMTTIINTHDMNSVMNIGENIIFIREGVKEWQGSKEQVISSSNAALNDFIFASDLLRKASELEEQQKKTGEK
jgi:phospholipid/cholesterol/gamma-HCH transport system ATP-binding protein